jgi:hypothetical protein
MFVEYLNRYLCGVRRQHPMAQPSTRQKLRPSSETPHPSPLSVSPCIAVQITEGSGSAFSSAMRAVTTVARAGIE